MSRLSGFAFRTALLLFVISVDFSVGTDNDYEQNVSKLIAEFITGYKRLKFGIIFTCAELSPENGIGSDDPAGSLLGAMFYDITKRLSAASVSFRAINIDDYDNIDDGGDDPAGDYRLRTDFKYARLMRELISHRQFVLLALECANSDVVLEQASRYELFNASFHWLIIDKKSAAHRRRGLDAATLEEDDDDGVDSSESFSVVNKNNSNRTTAPGGLSKGDGRMHRLRAPKHGTGDCLVKFMDSQAAGNDHRQQQLQQEQEQQQQNNCLLASMAAMSKIGGPVFGHNPDGTVAPDDDDDDGEDDKNAPRAESDGRSCNAALPSLDPAEDSVRHPVNSVPLFRSVADDGSASDRTFGRFETMNISINAEITLAMPTSASYRTFALFDIWNPGFLNGGCLNVTWLGRFVVQDENDTVGLLKVPFHETTVIRRRDMKGLKLKIMTVVTQKPHQPFDVYLSTPKNTHLDSVHRYNFGLMSYLRDYFNFRFITRRTKSWGYLRNGTFDGMIGALARREVDIGGSPCFFRQERHRVISYTTRSFIERPCFIFRHPKRQNSMRNPFLLPFETIIWYLMVICGALLAVVLFCSLCIEDSGFVQRARRFSSIGHANNGFDPESGKENFDFVSSKQSYYRDSFPCNSNNNKNINEKLAQIVNGDTKKNAPYNDENKNNNNNNKNTGMHDYDPQCHLRYRRMKGATNGANNGRWRQGGRTLLSAQRQLSDQHRMTKEGCYQHNQKTALVPRNAATAAAVGKIGSNSDKNHSQLLLAQMDKFAKVGRLKLADENENGGDETAVGSNDAAKQESAARASGFSPNDGNGNSNYKAEKLSKSALLFLGSVCQQGLSEIPNLLSGKCTSFFILLFGYLMFQYYSASIVGSLLMAPPKNIKTLRNLIDSRLVLEIEDIPYNRDYFVRTTDSDSLELYRTRIAFFNEKTRQNESHFSNAAEGLRLVKSGGYAFHVAISAAYKIIRETFSEQDVCELTEIDMFPIYAQWMVAIVQKNSPYRDVITYGLRRLNEAGIMDHQRKVWQEPKPKCVREMAPTDLIVGMDGVYSAFILLFAGSLLSGGLLLIEILHRQLLATTGNFHGPDHRRNRLNGGGSLGCGCLMRHRSNSDPGVVYPYVD
ncbi:uncharacterized protein LOC129757700 [Uranotaenia lowii]|uniref:uncharacterized protein LOC129757700 n=1 Tax=Uranotaenia lowii TaxID=190385 RepID=UPI00247B0BB0|nr:uncharacterized protein LOC129757700 [Uranotaenia lowii]